MVKTVNFTCILAQLKIRYIRQCLTWGFIHIVAPKVLEAEKKRFNCSMENEPQALWPRTFPFQKACPTF